VLGRSLEIAELLLEAGIDTSPRYNLGLSRQAVDAVVFAILHGARDIAILIASRKECGDPALAARAIDDAISVANAITLRTEE
jgi:hypothetical protein